MGAIWRFCRSLCQGPVEEYYDHNKSLLSDPLVQFTDEQYEYDMHPEDIPNFEPLEYYAEELPYVPVPRFPENYWSYKKIFEHLVVQIVSFKDEYLQEGLYQNADKLRITMSEVKLMSRLLPCEETNAIFVAVNEKNTSTMEAIIIGTEGTPYEHGIFLFSIELSDDYPKTAPRVTLLTTGGGRIRFNPNLYENGYVCLSLLGTWRGYERYNWQPYKSNISQVLMSIQTLVMSCDVFFNEPGFYDLDRQIDEPANRAYSNIVRYGNITYAMNEMLYNPPVRFEHIIKTHFYLKKNRIIQSVEKWIEESQEDALYTEHSDYHNYNMSARYVENDFNYKNDLIRQMDRLHRNLQNIRIEDTIIQKI